MKRSEIVVFSAILLIVLLCSFGLAETWEEDVGESHEWYGPISGEESSDIPYYSSHKCFVELAYNGQPLPVLNTSYITNTDFYHQSEIIYGNEDYEQGTLDFGSETLHFHVQDYPSNPDGYTTFYFIFPFE